MEWVKQLQPGAAADGGWRDDFPLNHDLPDSVVVDCRKLRMPIQPMFAVRLRIFVDWHRDQEREVRILPPTDAVAGRASRSMSIDPEADRAADVDSVVPVTRMAEFKEVEILAEETRELIEYELHDVSPLGDATF